MATARSIFTHNLLCLLGGLLLSSAVAFMPSLPSAAVLPREATTTTTTHVASSTSDDEIVNMAKILQEEAMNAENLKASAKEMQNLKPGQIDDMIREMENMPSWQKEQLKKMGMDPEMMKASMQQFKENPELLKNMGQAMENMTPEQLMESSKAAQEQMRAAQQQQASTITSAPAVTDAEIVSEDDGDEDEEEDQDDEPIEPVPEVLDAMYEVAKIMGNGKVTFGSFCTLPVITLLSGNGEDDLDQKELKECWNKGSLGATNLDRAAFERVWREIQDNYYSDIVEEAQLRMPSKKRAKKRGSADKSKSAVATPASPSISTPPTTPMVGASISPEMLKQQVDNISDDDMKAMFESMTNMTPEQEARMKAMGADPAMMKKSAEMMKNNPLLRNAAKAMIKNTPPEQIMKASQEAQERMQNMSEEEKKRLMDGMM